MLPSATDIYWEGAEEMKKRHLLTGLAGVVLLLTVSMGRALAAETSGDTAQKSLETSMGKMYMTEWLRVKSQTDLRECTKETPMRLYALYTATQGYQIYNISEDATDTVQLERKELDSAIYGNKNYVEMSAEKPTDYGYIMYSGENDSDDNLQSPMCYISLNSTMKTWLATDDSRDLNLNASTPSKWTVYFSRTQSGTYTSLFVNYSWKTDPTIWVDNSGKLYSSTSGNNSSYQKYAMYIGKVTDITVIQKDVTVGDGQTVRIGEEGGIALQEGVTLTIEKGGTAIVQSRFLNQGTIINRGTIVVMDQGSLQPVYDTGGTLLCEGGDLIITKGGRFMSGEKLTLKKGSSIVNEGIFLTGQDVSLEDATLITEEGGYTLLGYNILATDFTNTGVTSVTDSALGSSQKIPSLRLATAKVLSESAFSISSKSKLKNYGTTVIHQTISGSGELIQAGGTLYYKK